jgi:hypothetical protein
MRAPRLPAIIALALIATMASGCGSAPGASSSSASPAAQVAGATSRPGSSTGSEPTLPEDRVTPAASQPESSADPGTDFKIDAAPELSGGTMGHLYIVKCNGVAGTWTASNGFSFTLDQNGHGTMSNDLGQTVTISLVLDTPSPYLQLAVPGIAIQKFPVTAGDFCNGDTPR